MSGYNQHEIAMQALDITYTRLRSFIKNMDKGQRERGVLALVTPPEPKGAAAAFKQTLRLPLSPETVNQLLKDREEQVGHDKLLREVTAATQPLSSPAAQPDLAALLGDYQ